jgi:ectoine hydroxylase-related dioxygenase (phytanoyl-CoA dioxygenase family)
LLEASPGVRAYAQSSEALSLVEPVLGPGCFAVRGTLFDKTPDARWKVAWHQDLSIAVRERRDVEGFGPWSLKAGVWHVQPPARVLETMLALRLHLDACDESSGALRVVPGSHARGRLSREEIERCLGAARPVTCAAPRGGALLMRPLLLHSSPTPRVVSRRRVIHLEYAAAALPGGLEWRR